MRFLGRLLTGLGLVALGADGLAFAETGRRTPYTIDWVISTLANPDAVATVTATASAGGGNLAALPVSLVLLWLGAMAFVFGRRMRRV